MNTISSLLREQGLVIASHNPGKAREIAELLQPLGITVHSAAELNLPEPEETGTSFTANAELKARAAAAKVRRPALADDSGLAVEALNGAPGIYSARWAGPKKDFAYAMRRIHSELQAAAIPSSHWQAAFICVLSLALPDGKIYSFEGKVEGLLTFPPRGTEGFGYDPIFIPAGDSRTFGEMPAQEKHRISHRARAFNKLIDFFETEDRKNAS